MAQVNIPKESNAHKNNCAIVAASAVTGIPYNTVHGEFVASAIYKEIGRGCGTKYGATTAWLKRQSDYTTITVRGYEGQTVASVLRQLDKNSVYLISINRHMFAYVYGVRVDTAVKQRSRVHGVWRVESNTLEPIPAIEQEVGVLREQPRPNIPENAAEYLRLQSGSRFSVWELSQILGIEEKKIRGQIDSARRRGYRIINENRKFYILPF